MDGWLMLKLGPCGWGFARGELPELRLGVLRLAWCPGGIMKHLRDNEVALRTAVRALRLTRRAAHLAPPPC